MGTKLLTWDEIVMFANNNEQIQWRCPKNSVGNTDWREGTIVRDEKATNPIRIKYKDIDNSFQTEGIWQSQIVKGNVEILRNN